MHNTLANTLIQSLGGFLSAGPTLSQVGSARLPNFWRVDLVKANGYAVHFKRVAVDDGCSARNRARCRRCGAGRQIQRGGKNER